MRCCTMSRPPPTTSSHWRGEHGGCDDVQPPISRCFRKVTAMTSQKIPPANATGEPENIFDDPEKWTDEGRPPSRHGYFKSEAFSSTKHCCHASILHDRRVSARTLIDHVVPIGRRALEVAIMEAVSQKELNPRPSEWEPEWSRIADASQDADVALDRLFRAIDPHGKDAEHFVRFIRQSRATVRVGASKAL